MLTNKIIEHFREQDLVEITNWDHPNTKDNDMFILATDDGRMMTVGILSAVISTCSSQGYKTLYKVRDIEKGYEVTYKHAFKLYVDRCLLIHSKAEGPVNIVGIKDNDHVIGWKRGDFFTIPVSEIVSIDDVPWGLDFDKDACPINMQKQATPIEDGDYPLPNRCREEGV